MLAKWRQRLLRVFGAQEMACQKGQFHDLGKYSGAFNRRLHGGPSVDHATAGAKIAKMLAL
jgi:CRISPR-associated helicase, cas3 family